MSKLGNDEESSGGGLWSGVLKLGGLHTTSELSALSNKIAFLEQRVAELDIEVAKERKQSAQTLQILVEAKKRSDKAEMRQEESALALQAEQKKAAESEERNSRLSAELAEQEKRLQVQIAENSALGATTEEGRAREFELEGKNAALLSEQKRLQDEAKAQRENMTRDHRAEILSLQEAHQRELEESQKQLEETKRKTDASIRGLKGELEEEKAKQTRKTESTVQEVQRQEARIAELLAQHAKQLEDTKRGYDLRLQEMQAQYSGRVSALEANHGGKIEALERQQEDKRKSDLLRLEDAERIDREKGKEIKALKHSHVKQLESEQTGHKERLDAITSENAHLQQELKAQQEKTLAALTERLNAEHQTEIQKLQTAHQEKLKGSEKLRNKHFDEAKALGQEKEKLGRQLGEANARNVELQRLQSANDEQSRTIETQKRAIEELREQKNQELLAVNKSLQELRLTNSEMTTKKDKEIEGLHEKLAAANAAKDAMQRGKEESQKQLEEANARNAALGTRLETQRVARQVREEAKAPQNRGIVVGQASSPIQGEVILQGVVDAPSSNAGRIVRQDADTYDKAIAEYAAQDEKKFFKQLGEPQIDESGKKIITYVHPDFDLNSDAAKDPKNQVIYTFDSSGKLESMSSGKDVTCKLPPQPKNNDSGYEMVRIDQGKPSYHINVGDGQSSTAVMTHRSERGGIQYTTVSPETLRSNTPSRTEAREMRGIMEKRGRSYSHIATLPDNAKVGHETGHSPLIT
jgi:hypothetical protein